MFNDRKIEYHGLTRFRDLSKITFGPNVKYIDCGAFYNTNIVSLNICYRLRDVQLPNTLVRVSSCCFANCPLLTSIVIPKSVRIIEYQAFQNCSKLTDVIFEEDSQLKTIGPFAFNGCTKLRNINFPKSLTKIEIFAFADCPIENVELHNVTYIGERAFDNINEDIIDGVMKHGIIENG